jgi:hypothetical protein
MLHFSGGIEAIAKGLLKYDRGGASDEKIFSTYDPGRLSWQKLNSFIPSLPSGSSTAAYIFLF